MLNSSKFPEDSAIHYQNSPWTLQGTAFTPPQMLLLTFELLHIPWVTYLGEHCQIGWKSTNSGKSLEWVTHDKTLHHHVEIPLPSGICSELIRHSNRKISSRRDVRTQSPYSTKSDGQCPTLGTNCCTGVVYDNLSVMFMLWAFSINNKVGYISFVSIYWWHQSFLICRRWSYSLIWTWNLVLCIRITTP